MDQLPQSDVTTAYIAVQVTIWQMVSHMKRTPIRLFLPSNMKRDYNLPLAFGD